tara:strand:+ start:244 stop:1368 length:1125 start_codon:yes stop_codon:yes gene_type:complete
LKNFNKILMLSHTYVKKINLSLPKSLSQKKNLDVVCVVPKKIFQGENIVYPDYKKNEIKIKLIESNLVNKSMRYQYFENIDKVIEKYQPNIIFLDNDTVCFQSLILIYWSFFYKYKLFYFCNENNLTNILSSFSVKKLIKFFIIAFLNLIIKFKIDKIFCYSKQIKNNYDFFGFKNKTRIVPLGFDRKIFFSKKKRKKLKNYKISYFGRITPEKGVHILIESLKKLKNFRWKLIIDIDYVENKSYFLKLKSDLKKNFPPKKYKFIKCDHFQIANYMRSSDIIVLPSLHEEQYGRVIQEGIACGNVAVGSNIGAIPEIIKDRSLLFKPGDFNSLALILKKLFNKRYYIKKMNKQKIDIINNRSIQSQANLILKSL